MSWWIAGLTMWDIGKMGADLLIRYELPVLSVERRGPGPGGLWRHGFTRGIDSTPRLDKPYSGRQAGLLCPGPEKGRQSSTSRRVGLGHVVLVMPNLLPTIL